MSVLAELTRKTAADATAARIAYRGLVKRLADGNDDPTLEDVEQILADADMDSSELVADVRRFQNRDNLRAQITAAAAASLRKEEIGRLVSEVRNELALATQKFNETVSAYQFELIDADRIIALGNNSARQLQKLCEDPELKARLATVNVQIAKLGDAIDEYREKISNLRAKIHGIEARQANRAPGSDVTDLSPVQLRLAGAERELAAFREKLPPLLAEQRAILNSMQAE
jgi:phage shock protein A